MRGEREARAHRRLEIQLPLECAPPDGQAGRTCRAVTRNVGSGGIYFETTEGGFHRGDTWELNLMVPPGIGHFPYPGQVKGVAQVCRVESLPPGDELSPHLKERFGVAARFRDPLELVFRDP